MIALVPCAIGLREVLHRGNIQLRCLLFLNVVTGMIALVPRANGLREVLNKENIQLRCLLFNFLLPSLELPMVVQTRSCGN